MLFLCVWLYVGLPRSVPVGALALGADLWIAVLLTRQPFVSAPLAAVVLNDQGKVPRSPT